MFDISLRELREWFLRKVNYQVLTNRLESFIDERTPVHLLLAGLVMFVLASLVAKVAK